MASGAVTAGRTVKKEEERCVRSSNFKIFCQSKDNTINCCVFRGVPKIAKSVCYLRYVCLLILLPARPHATPLTLYGFS